jgi:hypothetical protein
VDCSWFRIFDDSRNAQDLGASAMSKRLLPAGANDYVRSLIRTGDDFLAIQAPTLQSRILISSGDHRVSSAWRESVVDEIESFASRPANWDSYGADSPRRDILEGAKSLISCIAESGVPSQPLVYPTRSGGIQFEWEKGSRYFEIDVVSKSAATFHYSDAAKKEMRSGEVFEKEFLDDVLSYLRKVEQADE